MKLQHQPRKVHLLKPNEFATWCGAHRVYKEGLIATTIFDDVTCGNCLRRVTDHRLNSLPVPYEAEKRRRRDLDRSTNSPVSECRQDEVENDG